MQCWILANYDSSDFSRVACSQRQDCKIYLYIHFRFFTISKHFTVLEKKRINCIFTVNTSVYHMDFAAGLGA